MVDLHRILPLVGDEVDGEEARHGAAKEDGADDETGHHVIETVDGSLRLGRRHGGRL